MAHDLTTGPRPLSPADTPGCRRWCGSVLLFELTAEREQSWIF